MILVRDIFQLKFGKAKDAKKQLAEAERLYKKYEIKNARTLTDLTGPSYTLVMESSWENLGEWEKSLKEGLKSEEWQNWYQNFVPLVDSASREIMSIVEIK